MSGAASIQWIDLFEIRLRIIPPLASKNDFNGLTFLTDLGKNLESLYIQNKNDPKKWKTLNKVVLRIYEVLQ